MKYDPFLVLSLYVEVCFDICKNSDFYFNALYFAAKR